MNIIQDPNFAQGLNVYDNVEHDKLSGIIAPTAGTTPVWNLGQMWSKSNILLSKPVAPALWGDKYKYVGIEQDGITLKINGMSEYGGREVDFDTAPWPHLNVSQRIGRLFSGMKSCVFSAGFDMVSCVRNSEPGYGDCTHYTACITIQNQNTASGEHGKLFNLSIPIYDSRYIAMPPITMFDSTPQVPGKPGTGNAIYNIGGTSLVNTMRKGCDILALAKMGLASVQKKGAMQGTQFSDLGIGSIIIGFECSNIDVTAIRVRCISLVMV